MTSNPHSVGVEQSLATAHALMQKYGIRHLPVLHANELKGIVSQRDLQLLESFESVDPKTATVEEAMWTGVYCVAADTPLDDVVTTMAEHKYGSAVVMDNHKVVGIFTTVDACRALAELLSTRLAK